MFKRPKGVSEIDEQETVDPNDDIPAKMRPMTPPLPQKSLSDPSADYSPLSPPSKTITPSYEARKPVVRTFQSPQSSGTTPVSMPAANLHVGRGLKLEGKIQSCDTLVIEGDVKATIESGTLTISESGDVSGEATVDEAEINGRFDGTLTVKKCLTINASGRVTGVVLYGELKVEQGGQISGEIQSAGQGKPDGLSNRARNEAQVDTSASSSSLASSLN